MVGLVNSAGRDSGLECDPKKTKKKKKKKKKKISRIQSTERLKE
jgi:hypothetical protein